MTVRKTEHDDDDDGDDDDINLDLLADDRYFG